MTESELLDLTVLERKKYNYLNEALDLSQQMGEALDRADQVSIQLLLALRGEPILHLQEVDRLEKSRKSGFSQEDIQRLEELCQGAAPQLREEGLFAEQAGKTRRLLERVVELDRRISLRMAGDHSFYHAGPPSRRPEAEEH